MITDTVLRTEYPAIRKMVYTWAGILITGKSVEFRFEDPPLDNCRGLAFRNGDNGAVIYIDPDLPDEDMLKTALHELAHIRFDHHRLMDIKDERKVVGRYRSELRMMPSTGEIMAQGQAAKWLDICGILAPGENSLRKLTALARHVKALKRW